MKTDRATEGAEAMTRLEELTAIRTEIEETHRRAKRNYDDVRAALREASTLRDAPIAELVRLVGEAARLELRAAWLIGYVDGLISEAA
jgi:hypothetical protein